MQQFSNPGRQVVREAGNCRESFCWYDFEFFIESRKKDLDFSEDPQYYDISWE